MLKADGEHTSHSELKTYAAYKMKQSAHLATSSFGDGVLRIIDGEHLWQMKLNYIDLICLAAVMRRWEADNQNIGTPEKPQGEERA